MLDIEKYRHSNEVWPGATIHTGIGDVCWKAMTVHKLTPDENRGKHHVYIVLLNDSYEFIYTVAFETKIGYSWEGMREDEQPNPITPDKRYPEPIANIPMYKGQKLNVWIQDHDFSSDVVSGLTVDLPDESEGNTYGHHSFLVVFKLSNIKNTENPVNPSEDDIKFIVNQKVIEELDEIIKRANNLRNAILNSYGFK